MTPNPSIIEEDVRLVEVFLEPIRKCAAYRPAFGHGNSTGLDLAAFHALYGGDSFYAWLGLDDPLVYAAHRAAGGLTSVYRQIGVGSERLLREVIMESLGLGRPQVRWQYEYHKSRGVSGVHILDARIAAADLSDASKAVFTDWLVDARAKVHQGRKHSKTNGAVFEVRQGYKSADSKRQSADLRFGLHAYRANLLPVFAILSTQVSEPVIQRYRNDGMLVLTGSLYDDPVVSTFAFFRNVVGYDLVGFFERNTKVLRAAVCSVVRSLLTPE